MAGPNVLVVDDDTGVRALLNRALTLKGATVFEAEGCTQAREIVARERADLAIVDVKLQDGNGIELMSHLFQMRHRPIVIVITANASIPSAIQAMKEGAYDYVPKPFDVDQVVKLSLGALDSAVLKGQVLTSDTELALKAGALEIIGKSDTALGAFDLVRKVARSELGTILLRGESGVGKDMIARAIHADSPRASKPFVTITCTTFQDTLLESELFGHEKGAFTGAQEMKQGLLERAQGGTVFLDEVGDMSLGIQSKLLRFLEQKTFRRVGGQQDLTIDARVIAATNKDLERAVQENRFREDLYYRLSVFPIFIPPLRERIDDIPRLVRHFIQIFNREFGKNIEGMSESAIDELKRYGWPGNVRELRNIVERAVLLSTDWIIRMEELRSVWPKTHRNRTSLELPPEGIDIDQVERSFLIQALERTQWRITEAAKLLGCSRHQIQYRIKKLGLDRPSINTP